MFLITTADQRFWDTRGKVLFLGEWCRLRRDRAVWEHLDHEVLPYHWDDRARLAADKELLETIYERQLAALSGRLNAIHGQAHSPRYWRILIGPWLCYFIHSLFDRYRCLSEAAASGRVTDTFIPRRREGFAPRDLEDCWLLLGSDGYNQHLYGLLIRDMGILPFHEKDVPGFPTLRDAAPPGSANGRMKALAKRTANLLSESLPDSGDRIVMVQTYFKTRELLRLQLALRQTPQLDFPPIPPLALPPDPIRRAALDGTPGSDGFEAALARLIPLQMPTAYVEDYARLRTAALTLYPERPKAILTSVALTYHDDFKFWAAEQTERGALLLGTQHGGLYGTGLMYADEDLELKACDRYFSWGWKSEKTRDVSPLPSAMLASRRRELRPTPDGKILWTLMAVPRYSREIWSAPMGPQYLSYLKDQAAFIKAVSPEVRELLLLRPYLHDYDWEQLDRCADLFTLPAVSSCHTPYLEALNACRLSISTYNSTTYLETLAADFPTLVFWDPAHWELRPSAVPYFERLRRAGILHYTPESAAKQINEVYRDPLRWWRQGEVQEAKDLFCRSFAACQEDWVRPWREELMTVKSGS